MSWREFWNRKNSIYVNDLHRSLHDGLVAEGIAGLLGATDKVVLDFGCGDASAADVVAAKCERLYLYDAAPVVRARLEQRFAGLASIVTPDDAGLAAIPQASVDLVVVNSVLQYVAKEDFEHLLDRFRNLLRSSGRLVLADVVSPDASAFADVGALLAFASRGGFLPAAGVGLVSTFFSDYRALRLRYGLTRYREAEMIALLAAHGFESARAPVNIGHNQARMMFVARPAAVSG